MKLTTCFSALGDPVRFAIVERLLSEGELSAGVLNEGVTISAPAMSRHLKVLRSAGLVTRRVNRQQRIYAVDPRAFQQISDWTQKHREFWTQSLDRLGAVLNEEDGI